MKSAGQFRRKAKNRIWNFKALAIFFRLMKYNDSKKFFALEAISAFPDFVTNTLIPITKSRLKDKEKPLEKTEISYVTEYLQKLSELLREEKLNEMIECPIM